MACKPLKPKPVRRKIFLWKKAEIHNIKEDLQNFITTFKNIKDRSVESLWQAFKTAVQTTIEKRVPTKMTLGRNTHPWINTTIRRKINQKQKAHKKARKTKKKRDKDRYKRLQQEVQWEVRQANKETTLLCHVVLYHPEPTGTCDLTTKEGKYIKLKFHNNRAIKIIEDQYKRAISIIDSYQHAEIKFIDCPLISISNWNKSKGHKRPETYKVEDFLATKQIQELNGKIYELNRRLNKTSVKISKYFFRGRKRRKGQTRKSVNLSINNKDGIHPGRLLSLAITKNILLDTYTECFTIDQESEFIQIRVEQEELNSLF
ncbi:unnamed protein product [Mytilus edulis]|uniref:Uncharacterized protein n=1 Tax=Mytilus edulis TaxID=6550 RepID=A0A8S3T0Q9_MYTED|nr:unnamed protein product [Mytilus edulis]